MKQKLVKLLRCKKGATYIDMVMLIIVSVMVIVLALNVFSFYTLRNDMDYIAAKTAEAVALVGSIDVDEHRKMQDGDQTQSIKEVFEQICESEGYETQSVGGSAFNKMSLEVTAKELYDEHHVQLGDPITVTVYCKRSFSGLGALTKGKTMGDPTNGVHVSKTTLSRVYFK